MTPLISMARDLPRFPQVPIILEEWGFPRSSTLHAPKEARHQNGKPSLSRLASSTCDFEDEPLSEQDLLAIQAIEAQFQSSLPTKRPLNPAQDDCITGTSTPASDSSHRIRLRLPKSLIAFNIHFRFLCHRVKLKKPSKVRLGNWEALPLSEQQLDYAATDAYASWYLYQVIRELPDPQVAAVEGRLKI